MGDDVHHLGGETSDLVKDILVQNISEFFSELSGNTANLHDHSVHDHQDGNVDHYVHSSHGADAHAGHIMKMWFHGGCEEVVLFDFWRVDSCIGMLISCILIFVMGALYEGIKWYRVQLQLQSDFRPKQNNEIQLHQAESLLETRADDVYAPTTTPPACQKLNHKPVNIVRSIACAPPRLLLAALYVFQLVLAYWLMLVVMTYNSYLTCAVILGAGFGHWLFAIIKPSSADSDSFATDACH